MGKGGRYLNTGNQPESGKKKGKGWKVLLIILVILAVLVGGIAAAGNGALDYILDKVTRAEFKENEEFDQSYWETYDYNNLD